MTSLFFTRFVGFAFCGPLLLAQQADPKPTAAEAAAAISKVPKDGKAVSPELAKLEPPLQAIARAWRLHGIRGAERESARQNVKLRRLRLAGVIHQVDEKRHAEVTSALRRAWGEVSAVEENRIYASIPVPALRRISSMAAVEFIYLDRPMRPGGGPSKERIR